MHCRLGSTGKATQISHGRNPNGTIHWFEKKEKGETLNCDYLVLNIWPVYRYGCFLDLFKHIQEHEGGLHQFTKGHHYYGVHRLPDNSIIVREWAPGTEGIYLKGDFSKFGGSITHRF